MRRALILALGTALAAGTLTAAVAQTPLAGTPAPKGDRGEGYDHTKPYPPYKAPRLAIGQPDLQGVWSNASLTQPSRPASAKSAVYSEEEVKKLENQVLVEIEEGNQRTDPNASATFENKSTVTRPEFQAAGGAVGGYNRGWLDPGNYVMRVNGEPRTSLITTPDGRPPAKKAGAPTVRAEQPEFVKLLGDSPTRAGGAFENMESRGAGERCIISFGRNGGPPMFANGFYNNNYQFIQSPNAVVIVVEMNHDARVIRLNAKHRTDDVRPYFGDAIGWWEGDTLVVETTNIPQSQNYMGSWKDLKVTERFTRVAPDRLHYKFTVEDPTMWDAAWGGEYEFHPLEPSRLYEYACHEGNYALHGILAGARVQEAEAAKKAAADAKAKPGAKPVKGGQ
ncbi:MAG TPA: hypothetical protein VFV70_04450 [Hyphomonadaceae bacterium]|nr:hypothetical protein [Hyphomonadaceae bacterium]